MPQTRLLLRWMRARWERRQMGSRLKPAMYPWLRSLTCSKNMVHRKRQCSCRPRDQSSLLSSSLDRSIWPSFINEVHHTLADDGVYGLRSDLCGVQGYALRYDKEDNLWSSSAVYRLIYREHFFRFSFYCKCTILFTVKGATYSICEINSRSSSSSAIKPLHAPNDSPEFHLISCSI